MNSFSKYVSLFLGVLLLCGCGAIQDIVRTDSETEIETPLRVTYGLSKRLRRAPRITAMRSISA